MQSHAIIANNTLQNIPLCLLKDTLEFCFNHITHKKECSVAVPFCSPLPNQQKSYHTNNQIILQSGPRVLYMILVSFNFLYEAYNNPNKTRAIQKGCSEVPSRSLSNAFP